MCSWRKQWYQRRVRGGFRPSKVMSLVTDEPEPEVPIEFQVHSKAKMTIEFYPRCFSYHGSGKFLKPYTYTTSGGLNLKLRRGKAIPYEVLWWSYEEGPGEISKDTDNETSERSKKKKKCRGKTCFYVKSPEEEISFLVYEDEDCKKIIALFNKNVTTKVPREASYTYKRFDATYEGEWENAMPHGQGTLKVKEGDKEFCGLWKCNKKQSGFGSGIYTAGKTHFQQPYGWRVTLPEPPGAEVVTYELDSNNEAQTQSGYFIHDIQSLCEKGELFSFQKGEVVLHKGTINRNLYIIKKGTVSIDLPKRGSKILGVNEMIGM
eukprot:TRINITY_DN6807_c0_g1_i3.p1 TRINITY_DN6807_c0_g1~~TRINITY_DN6807_c0_g1_i3.p1  ORF type:complete len:320 (-),score=74.52 TRINITY_DN6807_c0_g1_i3:331-1290(-)